MSDYTEENNPAQSDKPWKWDAVFSEELKYINRRRKMLDEKDDRELVGLAISGGGIRSATFALGVLEALRDLGLLKKVDYLSTVSGGGYIGSWLSANCRRARDHDLSDWLEPPSKEDSKPSVDHWKPSIDHLRRYSNYLSPNVGMFSADTWSMGAVWLRNTLLVQVTVILAIAVLLLLPRPLFAVFEQWPEVGHWRWMTVILFILGVVGIAGNQLRLNWPDFRFLSIRGWQIGLCLAAITGLIAWFIKHFNNADPFGSDPMHLSVALPFGLLLVLTGFFLQPVAVKLVNFFSTSANPPENVNYTQAWVQGVVVIPMLAVGYLTAAVMWEQSQPDSSNLAKLGGFSDFFLEAWNQWPFPLSVMFVSLWLLSCCSIRRWDWKGWLVGVAVAPASAMVVLHSLLSVIMLFFHQWVKLGADGKWLAYSFGPALVIVALGLTVVMLIGMLGRQSGEGGREWWSRFGAWLGIYGVGWLLINLAAVYGPSAADYFLDTNTWKGLGIGGWLGTTIAGIMAGKSDKATGASNQGNPWVELLAKIAPFVFILGLLIAVACGVHSLLDLMSAPDPGTALTNGELKASLGMLAGGAFCVSLLAMRVDINEFSLNAFYRSRLVRCYLGATRFRKDEREPQNFTQFDDADDLKLAAMIDDKSSEPLAGPLPIVNCALNLGGSSDLSLHTRHSANFTLTPLFCGSRYVSRSLEGMPEMGYRRTTDYGGADGQPTLGQAVSVSGAAASPNMGYHTSQVVAFLLTMFNMRLGWWFPNPRETGIGSPSPWFSLRYLLMELFGAADDRSKYLAISDGGHFENLAAYELLKRKCRVILISDGECDPKLQFEGLGTLVRMAEVDFNAQIKIDVRSIQPLGSSPWSHNRYAVGRIRYDDRSEAVLIYLKASMSGNEDTAVLQYKNAHSDFPHETTGDQFYGEDQFESYRRLGFDVATEAFNDVDHNGSFVDLAEHLKRIRAPSLPNTDQFTEYTTQLMEIWSRLGNTAGLDALDQELTKGWPEKPPVGFRSGFYLCSQLIQLMENVYSGMKLEETWEHADNSGWRELFDRWTRSSVFRETWKLTYKTYGRRFRHFCHRRFDLDNPEE